MWAPWQPETLNNATIDTLSARARESGMGHRIAGIDVHKRMLAIVVADVAVDGEFQFERQTLGTSPDQLHALADWRDNAVASAAPGPPTPGRQYCAVDSITISSTALATHERRAAAPRQRPARRIAHHYRRTPESTCDSALVREKRDSRPQNP
jgi:hypothetical protein